MNVRLSVAFLLLVGCGGRGASPPAAAAPPPEVVKALQVPENPYRIIYTPPVSLAKPPDTTAHVRKPGGGGHNRGGPAPEPPAAERKWGPSCAALGGSGLASGR